MGTPCKPSPLRLAEIQKLMTVLRGVKRNAWITAHEISLQIYGKSDENSKRRVRLIAGAARPAVFSFAGSPGYKLLDQTSKEEMEEAFAQIDAAEIALRKDRRILQHAYKLRFSVIQRGDHPSQMLLL